MPEASLFGDDLPEPVPPQGRAANKAQPKPPRKPTAKELRERAPGVQYRAPAKDSEDAELVNFLQLIAQHDMMSPEDMEKYSEIIEPVISKASREKMKDWRRLHGI